MKVYLAGKITKNGWRKSIFPKIRDMTDEDLSGKEVIVEEHTIVDGYKYVGPYFLADDHGMFHGDSTHGRGLGTGEVNDIMPDWKIERRDTVVEKCFSGIEECDAMFVWVNEEDIMGTIAEIGYAKAKGKPVFVAIEERLRDSDFVKDSWFAFHAADYRLFFYEVEQAWTYFTYEFIENGKYRSKKDKSGNASEKQKSFLSKLCFDNKVTVKEEMNELSKDVASLLISYLGNGGGSEDERIDMYLRGMSEEEKEEADRYFPHYKEDEVVEEVKNRFCNEVDFEFDEEKHDEYVSFYQVESEEKWFHEVPEKWYLRFFSVDWIDFLCRRIEEDEGRETYDRRE